MTVSTLTDLYRTCCCTHITRNNFAQVFYTRGKSLTHTTSGSTCYVSELSQLLIHSYIPSNIFIMVFSSWMLLGLKYLLIASLFWGIIDIESCLPLYDRCTSREELFHYSDIYSCQGHLFYS